MKPTNHFTVRTEHIPTKEKGRTDQSAPQVQPFVKRNSTAPDPLQSWFNLAKPARERQQKRGKQRGGIDAYLLAQLALFAVLLALIVGGLTYA